MLDEGGIRDHAAVHLAGSVEGVAGGHDRGDLGAAEDLVVDLAVDGAEFAVLVPVGAERLVGILGQEGAHVVGGGELLVEDRHLLARGGDVSSGRDHFVHDVLDLAVGALLEELLVLLVVVADLGGAHGDGAVGDHRVEREDIVHVGRGVAFLDRLGELQGIVHAAGVEQRTVLGVELLVVDGVLDIVPVGAQAAALVAVDLRDEGLEPVGGEVARLVHEQGVLGDGRGDVFAAHQGDHLILADGDARSPGVLDKHVLVKEFLPGGVADLLLGLLVADGAGHQFVDGRVAVDVRLEIRVGNVLACNLSDVVFGRHRVECRLERARVDNERQKGQRDDDRDHEAKLNAYFFKYRHDYLFFKFSDKGLRI